MKGMGLQGVRRNGRRFITTAADPDLANRPADLVNRNFKATAPNQIWVVDFCYVPTWEGMAFCAFVQDVFSRRVVGWRVAGHMKTDLPLDALEMALWVRDRSGQDITGLIQHSDMGSQYTAIRYMDRLAEVGVIASIGSVGDSYDNAMAESINGLYKAECTKLEGPLKTVDQLELATCDWVHYWNTNRLHSSLGYVPPAEFEQAHYAVKRPQLQPA
jgi:putative transposase